MKKHITTTLIMLCCIRAMTQTPVNDPHWSIFFEDDFSGTSVNTSKWNFNPPEGNCDGKAHQTNPYNNGTNHHISNGIIKLISKKETSTCQDWTGTTYTKPYTTGTLHSKTAFKYGYFEIRCKIPELSNSILPEKVLVHVFGCGQQLPILMIR